MHDWFLSLSLTILLGTAIQSNANKQKRKNVFNVLAKVWQYNLDVTY